MTSAIAVPAEVIAGLCNRGSKISRRTGAHGKRVPASAAASTASIMSFRPGQYRTRPAPPSRPGPARDRELRSADAPQPGRAKQDRLAADEVPVPPVGRPGWTIAFKACPFARFPVASPSTLTATGADQVSPSSRRALLLAATRADIGQYRATRRRTSGDDQRRTSAALPSAGGHADHPDLRQARAMPSRLARHAVR